MILIADSGSTKTEWITPETTAITRGINPVRDTKEEIWEVISTELMPNLCHDNYLDITQNNHHRALSSITQVHFYGAGCIQPFSHSVREILEETFSSASIHIYSDLLGAARALCGKDEGIACILGTGSNSCLCNNGEIVRNISPLGYILGDEGSGAVLGRILLSEMTKGNMQNLWPHFSEQYKLSISDIISKVYRQPQANRFLASLTPFIKDNLHLPSIKDMLTTEFLRFLQRNVIPYGRTDLPVNFVGGIANNFTEEIMTACELCGLKSGKVVANPAKNLLKYHIHVI